MNQTEALLIARIDPIHAEPGSILYQPIVSTRNEHIFIATRARVDAFVKLEGGRGLRIGERVHIASFCHVNIGGGETILEEGASMGSGAKTISGGNAPDAISASRVVDDEEQLLTYAKIVIGKNACLYANAIAYCKEGVLTIGEGSRIGAGSLLLQSVPPGEVWAGVPARFIRKVRLPEPAPAAETRLDA